MALTFQTGINQHSQNNLTDYALFLGGLNVTRDALLQYDPLKTGFGRIFMIRRPLFLEKIASTDENFRGKLNKFKHVLEYANTGVSGNNNISVQFNPMQGGYSNKSMDIPNIAQDDANELVIKTYEFSGSLMRELIQFWINGVTDIQTGYSHYNGADLPIQQANHTAEFIYLVTDQSGRKVEYACLWANCFPKEIKLDHFNYDAGQHELVQMDIAFSATRYISPQINDLATRLNQRYNVLMNSLNFHSGYTFSKIDLESTRGTNSVGTYYNNISGKFAPKSKADANTIIGQNADYVPVATPTYYKSSSGSVVPVEN